MSIRVIVRSVDHSTAAHVGGPSETYHATFLVEFPELETYLRAPKPGNFLTREVIGVELIEAKGARE